MKRMSFLIFMTVSVITVRSQDSISYHQDEQVIDSLENLLLEGNYGSGVNANFTLSKFFVQNPKKMSPHVPIVAFGFPSLSNRNLSHIGYVSDAVLGSMSFEGGVTFYDIDIDIRISKKHGWFFFTSVGWRGQAYQSIANTAFKSVDNKTVQMPADSGINYISTTLGQFYIQIPFMVEYQRKVFGSSSVFFQAGVDLGIKCYSWSEILYRNPENKRIRETLGKGMNVNPLSLDLKAVLGFSNVAFYFRYGLIDFFRKGRGTEVIPVAFGFEFRF